MPQSNKYTEESDRLVSVEILTEANAKAINDLTKTISKLSELMAKEDESLKASVKQLQENSIRCEARHQAFLETLTSKKEIIQEITKQLSTKADKSEVTAIKNVLLKVMWSIFGLLGTIVGSALLFYLEHRGGN